MTSDSQLGTNLGRAIFGDPQLSGKIAYQDAQTRAAAALAGYRQKQAEEQQIINDALTRTGDFFSSFKAPRDASGKPVPMDQYGFMETFAPVAGSMAQAGDAGSVDEIMRAFGSFAGGDDLATRASIAAGGMPGPDFSPSMARADEVSARNASEEMAKAFGVQKIANQKKGKESDLAKADYEVLEGELGQYLGDMDPAAQGKIRARASGILNTTDATIPEAARLAIALEQEENPDFLVPGSSGFFGFGGKPGHDILPQDEVDALIQAFDTDAQAAISGQPAPQQPAEEVPAAETNPAEADAGAPVPGAKQARDGNWYVPDPKRPGKYLMVK